MSEEENIDHSKDGQPIFITLNADSQEVTEISSLCMNCHKQGTTRLMLTKIPHFKEILLMAFECPHCGARNNEIKNAHAISEMGVNYCLKIHEASDLNRQVVKSDSASIFIPDLEFEIPPSNGELNTIEGILRKAIDDLSFDQGMRKLEQPESFRKIEIFVKSLSELMDLDKPFTFILDDPSGNSYIQDIPHSTTDKLLKVMHYKRTSEQDHKLGIFSQAELNKSSSNDDHDEVEHCTLSPQPEMPEIVVFSTNCSNCAAKIDAKMQFINIPYFKETIIMASSCDRCGYKTNEVKGGGAISAKGRRITLKVTNPDDLNRDILKSDSAAVFIPEADLELTYGTLGGRFTTLEGLLTEIRDELNNRASFIIGDSAEEQQKLTDFLSLLEKTISNEIDFTIILDDPLANSYLQNPYAPDHDPNMEIVEYERTFEQNECFGLNDMKTDNYE